MLRIAGGLPLAAITVLVLASSGSRPAASAPAAVDRCYGCHKDIDSPEARIWARDVHYAAGLVCADCHGGDPTLDDQDTAMSRDKGFKGKIRKSDIPVVCGACHGSQDTPWRHSHNLTDVADSLMSGVHGQALRQSDAGPQCVSCHGVHEILPVSDPHSPVNVLNIPQTCGTCHSDARYMRDFDPRLPVDQLQKYRTSEHGKRNAAGDPKPATCVSCHSNHLVLKVKDPRSPVYATRVPETCAKCHADTKYMAAYHIPTDQYEKYRRGRHGVALLEHSDLNAPACNACHGNHAAMPPGSDAIVSICGNCHQANAELFEKSPHKELFAKKNLPGCVVCHSNHGIASPTDRLVGFDPAGPCARCHKNDSSDPAARTIVALRAELDSLHLGQSQADSLLDRAEQLGMDVSDARYDLKGAHQALVESRVTIHSFRLADLTGVARPGISIVQTARHAGADAIHEYYFRRKGLAISTLIVTAMALLLFFKIREIEREDRKR